MSYFDNANNNVTRKSFGSKVDKEFKREGVIPIKDRNKDKKDALAESAAKYQELNKQVDARRLKDLKEQKAYDAKMQEGYTNLKNDLMKDFISEICVESLLVDEDVVNENIKNIVEMVERHVDDIGGFEGVKRIAETYNNPVLLNMVRVCETTAKKVGERNLKESEGCASKVNFCLNKVELEEYDYKKKEMGSEAIVDNIKDKVFQVVQDEQKLNSDKQMVMDEIQNKVSEMEMEGEGEESNEAPPVEEAMKFIFESAGIEEDTLFGSMMRSHYRQIVESKSSAIFESFDYKEINGPSVENYEFLMNDVELVDEEIENEEIEDMFLNEARMLEDCADDKYEETIEALYQKLNEGSQYIYVKSQARHFKGIVRKVQNIIESIDEPVLYCEESTNKLLNTNFHVDGIRNKLLGLQEDSGLMDDSNLTHDLKGEKELAKETEKELKDSAKKAATEEVIMCPKCGKEQCSCKVAKESDSIRESYILKLEGICESMDKIIDMHEEARSNVIESLTREIDDKVTLVPYLQTKDVNLNNIEFAYKTKLVCESLKNSLSSVHYLEQANVMHKIVEMNIKSIEETINAIKDNPSFEYKTNILNKGKGYLNKVQQVIESFDCESNESVIEENSVFKTPEDVERIFNKVSEYCVIESTDRELMELVMAEAIVEYTILETFNTLNLIRYTKDSVRQMARRNISGK